MLGRKLGQARRVTLPSQRGDPRSPLFVSFFFVVVVSRGSPRFTKKCLKSWLAQRSSGRPVNLLLQTSFSRSLKKTSYIFEKDISPRSSLIMPLWSLNESKLCNVYSVIITLK